jgi:hypothetical protein
MKNRLPSKFHGKRFNGGFAGRYKHLNHWTVRKTAQSFDATSHRARIRPAGQ